MRKIRFRNIFFIISLLIGCNLLVCCKTFDFYNSDNNHAEIPLFSAIAEKDITKVKELISQGVDVNERDNCGRNAIMYAYSKYASSEKDNFLRNVIEILLKADSSDIVNINSKQVVRAFLFDDEVVNKYHMQPVGFKYCYFSKYDKCPMDVLTEAHEIIKKGCF